jgi:acetyl esterase
VSGEIHPETAALIALFVGAGATPLPDGTVAEARARSSRLPEMLGPGPRVFEVEDLGVPGKDGPVPVRIYSPVPNPAATMVYFHGGGWVLGSLDISDAYARTLAVETRCRLVNVGYRLAPEHRFPAALEDALAATRWAAGAYGDGPIIVGGDSAGGNLATVVARRLRDAGEAGPVLQVLIYPVTDHDFTTDSYLEHADNPLMGRGDMEWFWDLYAPSIPERDGPDASPLRTADLSGMPPTLIVAAAHDPIRDDATAYAERLREAGVQVELHFYEDQTHGFFVMVNYLNSSNAAIRRLAASINASLWGDARHDDRNKEFDSGGER